MDCTKRRYRFVRLRPLRFLIISSLCISIVLFCRQLPMVATRSQQVALDGGGHKSGSTVYLADNDTSDYTQYVNVFSGTENGGNDFPGVTRPWGMVKIGPDNFEPGVNSYSGYAPWAPFSGFSLMHESGTGGAPKYGTISQLPLIGSIKNPLANITVERAVADRGSVGYYRAETVYGVVIELAATSHAAIYQYTFPSNVQCNILIDVSHILTSYRGNGLKQGYAGGSLTLYPDGHYEGSGTYNNGWNRAPNWTIYFYGYFDSTPISAQVFSATGLADSVFQEGGSVSSTNDQTRIGGMFTFSAETTSVTSRVGISWISIKKARQNVDGEIPAGTALQKVVEDTKSAWNEEVLSKITIKSPSTESRQLLYTSLYFMNLLPTNQTDENPGWTSAEPYYSDIFTLWDLFRCSTPLLHIINPKVYEEFIRSLIDIWRHDGYLPDARSSNYNGRTQVGSNADNVLADAFVKGVRGKINWNDGYAAMVKDAEVAPLNLDPPDPQAPDASTKEGRGGLSDWIEHGFITKPIYTRSVSRAVEYAYNDFSLYQVAKGLGNDDDAAKYLNRSRNWRNHWNPNLESLGFTGFVGPRSLTDFIPITPLEDRGYWVGPFYEGGTWDYSWTDVHDINKMIELMGGTKRTLDRLETMFQVGKHPKFPNGTIYDESNEPTFNLPYLYNYLSRQDLSVLRSRTIAKKFKTTVDGLPGNSDAGAMQTWLLWNMVGLYPITGQTTFLIHSPWFEFMKIDLGDGKKLLITSTGGDGTGDAKFYVQSLKVNGKRWTKSWLTWSDVFAHGGTMEFVLGNEPRNWATGPLPPSPATETSL